jgi:hypothetical protein
MRSCCCVCILPIVARQGLGKNLLIVARQWLGKNPPIIARQRLCRNVTAVTNTHARIELLDESQCGLCRIKESRRLVLPRTCRFYSCQQTLNTTLLSANCCIPHHPSLC